MTVTQIHGSDQIQSATITNSEISATAAIATSKLTDGAKFIQRDGSVAYTADQPYGTHKITGLGDPTNPQDGATKAYVDAVSIGLDVKASVRMATVVAGTLATSFAAGQNIDGIALVTGDRILIKNQATGSENGIYTVNASGAPSRATDADTSAEVTAGMFTFVEEGTVNADTGWILTTNAVIVLGTTALVFTQFSGPGAIVAGAGLTQTGTTIDVVAGNVGITVGSNNIDLTMTASSDAAPEVGRRVFRAVPVGTVNGINAIFTLAQNCWANSEEVFLNGILQEPAGEDYTVSGAGNKTITFVSAPKSGARIRVHYTMQ